MRKQWFALVRKAEDLGYATFLLAVNATAHCLWPFLPVADTYAQHMAQQLITKGKSG